jgi:hypothetical protein
MATKPFTDSTPGIPQENLPNFRAHLVRSIEHMIGLLDALDACCDLEDSDPLEMEQDACTAGDDGNPVPGRTDWSAGDADDAEDSHDAEAVNEDGEVPYGADDQWHRNKKDLELFTQRQGRDLPGPGRVRRERGGLYWYPDASKTAKQVLEELLADKAND